jgi:hypothetical protein
MNPFSSFHVAILGCNQRQRKQSTDKPTSEFKEREKKTSNSMLTQQLQARFSMSLLNSIMTEVTATIR